MKKSNLIVLAIVLGAIGVAGYQTRDSWHGAGAATKAAPVRAVSVEIARAERKPVPVDVASIGTVTPISSVALKSRIETTIINVHFEDGARVSEGDLLFTLDARQIDAQIEQAEGTLARDQAQLAGAQRDLRRYSDLIGKGATTQVNLDNAKTQADILIGTIKADQAALDNLKVQKSYTVIRAPVAGRISAANVKVGNFVRPADTAQVSQVVRLCAQAGVPLVPQGGNTGLVGGSTPDDSGREIVVGLGRMTALRRVDPLGNSITLEAGCTILAAQAAARECGRLFPLSLASEGSATIGGALSTNAGGEQVLRYGNTRELTLGLEVVLADGRVLDALTTSRRNYHSSMLADQLGNFPLSTAGENAAALSRRIQEQAAVLTSADLYLCMAGVAVLLILLIPFVATRIYPPRAAA